MTRKTRIIDVIYNASNNELVRTKTLVKSCIVQIDSTPFRQWYEAHYATPLGRKKGVKLVGLGCKCNRNGEGSKKGRTFNVFFIAEESCPLMRNIYLSHSLLCHTFVKMEATQLSSVLAGTLSWLFLDIIYCAQF